MKSAGRSPLPVAEPAASFPEGLFRPESETVDQDWAALARYLDGQGLTLATAPAPRQFAGGLANLNYLVVVDGREAVLRRPPMGPLPPGAFDMGRESKILSRLWEQFPLAPRALHLCLDGAVLGAPFQLTEFRRGVSYRDTLPPHLAGDAQACAHLGRLLIEVLAQLHAVDPDRVGLGDLGRPDGFLERAVGGWSKRGRLALDGWASEPTLRRFEALCAWLQANRVPDRAINLIHNDVKLDNLLIDPDTLAPVALLDWDQGTRGDGLFDLATLLAYWTQPDDPPAMHQLQQMPTLLPGFQTREAAADAYAQATGRDLSDFRFHRVLAMLKTAVIFAQLHARWRAGGTDDARYAEMGALASGLLDFADDIAHGRSF